MLGSALLCSEVLWLWCDWAELEPSLEESEEGIVNMKRFEVREYEMEGSLDWFYDSNVGIWGRQMDPIYIPRIPVSCQVPLRIDRTSQDHARCGEIDHWVDPERQPWVTCIVSNSVMTLESHFRANF
jgi:hypothetical protein